MERKTENHENSNNLEEVKNSNNHDESETLITTPTTTIPSNDNNDNLHVQSNGNSNSNSNSNDNEIILCNGDEGNSNGDGVTKIMTEVQEEDNECLNNNEHSDNDDGMKKNTEVNDLERSTDQEAELIIIEQDESLSSRKDNHDQEYDTIQEIMKGESQTLINESPNHPFRHTSLLAIPTSEEEDNNNNINNLDNEDHNIINEDEEYEDDGIEEKDDALHVDKSELTQIMQTLTPDTTSDSNGNTTTQLQSKKQKELASPITAKPASTLSSQKSPERPSTQLLNTFASWRSKADAVIQNSEVLKAAQKNIIEKRNEVEKAVGINFATTLNISRKDSAKPKVEEDQTSASPSASTSIDDESLPLNYNKESKMNDVIKSDITRNTNDNVQIVSDTGESLLDSLVVKDDQSKQSKLILDEDEFSYDSQEVPNDDSDSEQSSVFVDDDGFSYSSDQSSVRVKMPFSKKSSMNDSQSNKSDSNEQVASSISKGRYAQNVTRPAILNRLQRKARVPSPPPSIPESQASSSFAAPTTKVFNTIQEAREFQLARIKRSFGGPPLESYMKNLGPGEYLMFLGQGMLGVNLKQTFLKGHGVYVDFVVPGGNGKN